ncbi:oligosaccharide flippase family protein [Sphingobacterium multivorum]|uniref:oligosaccharide flippase family protein n=1 Tax=Sphingobacterium multivorum TaxID=28454 RepID=UPI00345E4379
MDLLRKIKGNALITDSFWAIFGNVILRGLSVVSGVLVARLLGSAPYGIFTTLKGLLLTVTVFSTMGLGYSATKFFAEYVTKEVGILKSLYRYIIRITLMFSAFIALVLFIISDWYARELLKDISLSFPVKILAVSIIFNALSFSQIGVISGLRRFKELSVLNVIVGVLSFGITILSTFLWGFEGSIYSLFISSLINYAANELFINRIISKEIHREGNLQYDIKKTILRETFPVALQEITYTLVSWLGPVLLIRYSNYTDVANYNIAMQWNAIILFVPGALRNVVLSHLSIDESQRKKAVMNQTLIINAISTAFPAILVFLISGYIVKLYGPQYSGLIDIIPLAVFITIPVSISNVYAQAFMTINKNWLMFLIRSIRDFSTIILFIVLLKSLNISAPFAMLYSSLICCSVTMLAFTIIYNSKQSGKI